MDKLKNLFNMNREEILNKAHQLAKKYFPDSQNIWARPNIEAQKVKYACIEMAEWLDKTMIDKVCEWLNMNIIDYITEGSREGISLENHKQLIDDFRKAMEE